MRVCIAHKEKSIRTLKDMTDGAEYDLCQDCFDHILPVLTGEFEKVSENKNRPGRPAKSKDGK